ncbi:TetR family transcriptional regulator [Actinophytocola xinjiangensis]|uniref:TetR family transcriptional regulator n=1 Tax=Actinophytocola xinjiangensis TaxID=485602 RepID=A0A7Z0WJL5_9PSEU|nr:TetR family transcriptional regulator [Actinophytocola xinjiangensis]OLF08543.1 TetR family transcriptional regulator [Actinophytocola xinjiangensis]
MAWDTEQTKRKLKDAAVAEFAAHGPGGTTMERVARRAGVNKERLYNYFGDKNSLFATVLADELNKVAAAVPLDHLDGPDAVADYAGAVHDYHAAHPELTRLLLWEGLAGLPRVPDETTRTRYYQAKVDTFARAQRAGLISDTLPPADLAFLVLALAGWWYAVPQMARMTHADAPGDPRAALRHAARRLAQPG